MTSRRCVYDLYIIIFTDKECGDLVNPLFGFVDLGERVVGSKAKYKCQEVRQHCTKHS